MVKNNGYTEKEKEELFEKLKRIANLFGLNIHLKENANGNNSSANIDGNKINLGMSWEENSSNKLNYQTLENIDQFLYLSQEEYFNFPYIIKSFLHEIAHLLTITDEKDVFEYQLQYDPFMSPEQYRKITYEKLADNLAYKLLNDNYQLIIKLLLGKKISIKRKKINKNIKTAMEMKGQYII